MCVKVSFQYHSSFKVKFRYVLSLAKTVLDANSHEYVYIYICFQFLLPISLQVVLPTVTSGEWKMTKAEGALVFTGPMERS